MHKGYKNTIAKLEQAGWKRQKHNFNIDPDDRTSGDSVYVSPDGKYKAIMSTIGEYGSNYQSIDISKNTKK